MEAKPKKRCAKYSRKSREEGLDQEFNSLDAQDEASSNFILSQRHEGWVEINEEYSDGGFSGGNTDRPGFKKLMDDAKAGKIDIIVFYKLDRFTRSLFDFADIMRELGKYDVSIVSVTEPLDSTTAAGKLFIHMLLSFAQFEREIAGERVRDKCAASKKKGKWMGGTPPLGYDSIDAKLQINNEEATLMKHIFSRFNEIGSATQLIKELNVAGYTTKSWTTKKDSSLNFPSN